MRYKRYGEADMDSILRRLHKFCKEQRLDEKKVNSLVDAIFANPKTYNLEEIAPVLLDIASDSSVDSMSIRAGLLELICEIKDSLLYTTLYADRDTCASLLDEKIVFDYDLWQNFSEPIALENTTTTVLGGVRLCRTSACRASNERFIIFRFDEWSDSDVVRELGFRKDNSFYNYGLIVMNIKTGTTWVCHVDDNKNTDRIPLDNELYGQKLKKQEFLDLIAKVNEFFADYSMEKTLADASAPFYLQVSRLNLLQNAVRKYSAAKSSVKRVQTVQGARKKAKAVGITDEKLTVVEPERDIVRSKYITLTDLMVKKVYEKKPWQGGHHASPCEHTVSEHIRHYKNGHTVKIPAHKRGGKNKTNSTNETNGRVVNTVVIKL